MLLLLLLRLRFVRFAMHFATASRSRVSCASSGSFTVRFAVCFELFMIVIVCSRLKLVQLLGPERKSGVSEAANAQLKCVYAYVDLQTLRY